jgi:GrpB-like predicted nucleotidyltransferase (UPF0157 family)
MPMSTADLLLDRVRSWAMSRADLVAIALVGSRARGNARDDSDLDLVILTDRPDLYINDPSWPTQLGCGPVTRVHRWGVITEQRAELGGLEVEFGIGAPEWARTDPVDEGTRRVVTDGMVAVYDPRDLLGNLVTEIAFDSWSRRRFAEGRAITLIDLYSMVAERRGVATHKLPLAERTQLWRRAMPVIWPGYQIPKGTERPDEPIEIVEYDADWPVRFDAWRARLANALGRSAVRIEHVGSTSIPGLPAKPVIDILVTVRDPDREHSYVPAIESLGLQLRSRDELHRYFRPVAGLPRDVQVHVCAVGSEWERRHLLFRDYLRTDESARSAYLEAKLRAAELWRDDRIAYADAKTGAIARIMEQAETWAAASAWGARSPD